MSADPIAPSSAVQPRLRRFLPPDEPSVQRIFRGTLALGRPLPFPLPGLARYERLCLRWYLRRGWSDAAVLDAGGMVFGYALACTDEADYRRWAVPATAAWLASVALALAGGRLPRDAAAFYRHRLLDGVEAVRRTTAPPMPAHAHLNLDRAARAGDSGLALLRHVDDRCRQAGLPGWYGEINCRRGRRGAALREAGFELVRRAPNHTLTWLLGEPVERLTVVRVLDGPSRRRAARRPCPSSLLTYGLRELTGRGLLDPTLIGAVPLGTPDEEITTVVDVRPWIGRKWAALTAHASQLGPGSLYHALPEDLRELVLGSEWFVGRALLGDGGRGIERDLLGGLRTPG
jgi:hypothetical protein